MMRLSVCLRRFAVFFLKKVNKMIGVFVADSQCDLMDLFVGGEKEVDRGLQSFFVQVS